MKTTFSTLWNSYYRYRHYPYYRYDNYKPSDSGVTYEWREPSHCSSNCYLGRM
jgi:hypothetical protein